MLKSIIKKLFAVPASAVNNLRSSNGSFLLNKTNFGIVRVDLSVIKKIAERSLTSVSGIKDCNLAVDNFSQPNPIKISLNLTVLDGFSATKISHDADSAINRALKNSLNLNFYVPVDVKIIDFAKHSAFKPRVR